MLADARAASRAPRHAVAPLIEPAATVAFGEEAPDQIVVLIREGEVRATNLGRSELPDEPLWRSAYRSSGTSNLHLTSWCVGQGIAQAQEVGRVVPIHPHAESNRLLRLSRCIREYALLAELDKLRETTLFDLSL